MFWHVLAMFWPCVLSRSRKSCRLSLFLKPGRKQLRSSCVRRFCRKAMNFAPEACARTHSFSAASDALIFAPSFLSVDNFFTSNFFISFFKTFRQL